MRRRALGLGLSLVIFAGLASPSLGCPPCQYESCFLGACACLPETGCVIPAPIDPGKLTEKLKHDPIGGITNPTGPYNSTGIPLQGDVVEFAIKNPDQVIRLIQDPGLIPYSAVASAMVANRNAVVSGNPNRIPADLLPFLRRWYSDDLLSSVRWTSNWGPLQQTLLAAQLQFNPRTQAITVLNAVIFRNDQLARNPALWAHELLHVQQYASWGVLGFAREWVNNSSNGGPVEAPAYAREDEAERVLATGTQPPPPFGPPVAVSPGLPSGWGLSPCGCWGYVNPAARQPAAQCASGVDIPRACPGWCPTGGMPWQHSCM